MGQELKNRLLPMSWWWRDALLPTGCRHRLERILNGKLSDEDANCLTQAYNARKFESRQFALSALPADVAQVFEELELLSATVPTLGAVIDVRTIVGQAAFQLLRLAAYKTDNIWLGRPDLRRTVFAFPNLSCYLAQARELLPKSPRGPRRRVSDHALLAAGIEVLARFGLGPYEDRSLAFLMEYSKSAGSVVATWTAMEQQITLLRLGRRAAA